MNMYLDHKRCNYVVRGVVTFKGTRESLETESINYERNTKCECNRLSSSQTRVYKAEINALGIYVFSAVLPNI